MDFVVAARNGTHVYHVDSPKEPALVQSLPPSWPGNAACLASHTSGCLAALQHQSGSVGIWEVPRLRDKKKEKAPSAAECSYPHCEVPSQSGAAAPIIRCYFSPHGSFLVTWEHIGGLKLEHVEGKGGGKAFARAENLRVWSLGRRPPEPKEFEVQISKDGTQRLGVNVDHLDGRSGLLVRRVDPGLVQQYNSSASPELVLAPGDQVVRVNKVSSESGASSLSEEIQRAKTLKLLVRKGPGFLAPATVARFFAPHISPLCWPPIQWTCDERFAFRFVKDEVQVLDGQTLAPTRRISVQHVSQLNVSQSFALDPAAPTCCFFAAFCPAASSCVPAMVRVFNSCGKAAKPILTKSLFSEAAWVTMRWDLVEGNDLLLLVHSSELTEDDVAFRTLHGQGGNGLYLLRPQSSEPVTALSTSEDVTLDVQWCPSSSGCKRMVVLQGPQPAQVIIISYTGSGGTQRQDLGRFGVRNSITCDTFGRSFCIHVQSERGMGLSNEADSADLFNLTTEGAVSHRTAVAVTRGERDQYLGPTISRIDFSPDGRALLANVQTEFGSELRFLNALDGKLLFRIKFEGSCTALWQPAPKGSFAAPEFPLPENVRSSVAPTVELRDKDWVWRELCTLQGKIQDLQAESSQPESAQCQTPEEQELHLALATLEDAAQAPPSHLIFQFTGVEGSTVITCHHADVLNGGSRDLAMRFCRQQHLEPSLANALAERLERLAPRGQAGGYAAPAAKPKAKAALKPKRAPVNTEDPEAVRRRVRALQKKLRDIAKLQQLPAASLDVLQKEKISTEPELARELAVLEDQLGLLERPPKMIFDVDTDRGVRQIRVYEGDDCYKLAQQFCHAENLDDEIAGLLAANMEQRLYQEFESEQ